MADRRRNHFVPRFLLNRFKSRADGKKSWVWQLSPDGKPIEISTRDAAVATQFYGGSETGVEDALAVAEARFARTLSALDAGEPARDHAECLRELVWNLAVRTRAFRRQFENVAERLTTKVIETITSEEVEDALVHFIRSDFDRLMDEGISSLSPEDQLLARAGSKSPPIRDALLESTEEMIRLLPKLFSAHALNIRESQGFLNAASEEGQIEGLSRLLTDSKVPDSFSPHIWEVHRTEPLLLGDVCVWAATEDGEVGSLLHSKNTWHTVYFPISPSQLLVAYHVSSVDLMDAEALNAASAKLSWSHIYCSAVSESFRRLAQTIGTGDPIMSEAELEELVSDDRGQVGEELVKRLREK